jgi:hypothetical protein
MGMGMDFEPPGNGEMRFEAPGNGKMKFEDLWLGYKEPSLMGLIGNSHIYHYFPFHFPFLPVLMYYTHLI